MLKKNWKIKSLVLDDILVTWLKKEDGFKNEELFEFAFINWKSLRKMPENESSIKQQIQERLVKFSGEGLVYCDYSTHTWWKTFEYPRNIINYLKKDMDKARCSICDHGGSTLIRLQPEEPEHVCPDCLTILDNLSSFSDPFIREIILNLEFDPMTEDLLLTFYNL